MAQMSAAAARVGDPTAHPGVIGPPGVPSVLIGGRPAATVGTAHQCASPAAHPPSALAPPGSTTVLIVGRPAARVGDLSGCGSAVVSGCASVLIGG
ncbi:PAAR repeat-containing protein [Streptomyces laurentii]|uniref:PAAR repeat-containing protein n=1 Tax=Streptomyces laurentii TaxID=39478 RepID=A0A160P800_STRLU|nr:PAAR repeat-containing protein [Streptomyces laurentii]